MNYIKGGIVLSLIATSLIASSNEFFQTTRDGWFYYKTDPVKQEKKKQDQNITDADFMQMLKYKDFTKMSAKEYGEAFTKAKDIATMNPTKENVGIVQRMNKWQTDQSEKFARVWTVNLLENPELEYPEIAKDKFGRSVQYAEQDKKTQDFFKQHKDDLGYVVFYNPASESATKKQRIVMDIFANKYGTTVEYINVQERQDLVKRFKLNVLPDIFFIYKNSKKEAIWMRVKAGIATQEEVVRNTMFLFDNAIKEGDK